MRISRAEMFQPPPIDTLQPSGKLERMEVLPQVREIGFAHGRRPAGLQQARRTALLPTRWRPASRLGCACGLRQQPGQEDDVHGTRRGALGRAVRLLVTSYQVWYRAGTAPEAVGSDCMRCRRLMALANGG